MPVGGSILTKYGGTPEPTPPRDTARRALVLLSIAAIVLAVGFFWGLTNLTGRRVFIVMTGAVVALATILNAVRGWREHGLLGVFYRNKHPLGTVLVNDEERSPTALAGWVILALTVSASALLIVLRGWPF